MKLKIHHREHLDFKNSNVYNLINQRLIVKINTKSWSNHLSFYIR